MNTRVIDPISYASECIVCAFQASISSVYGIVPPLYPTTPYVHTYIVLVVRCLLVTREQMLSIVVYYRVSRGGLKFPHELASTPAHYTVGAR